MDILLIGYFIGLVTMTLYSALAWKKLKEEVGDIATITTFLVFLVVFWPVILPFVIAIRFLMKKKEK